MNITHYYFQLTEQPRAGVIPSITKDILEFYSTKKLTKKQWVKEPPFVVKYKKEEEVEFRVSKPISYSELAKNIRLFGSFSSEEYNLPKYECFWLDNNIVMQINFHKFDDGSSEALTICIDSPKQMYGEKFPISPKLDREGHVISSMQASLIQRIINLRKTLIAESNKALYIEWVFDLRTLMSDVISLVEITLHQIYTKAEYDPLPGWRFDKTKLGKKHGRRVTDKLKWIGQITGNPLDDARDEVISLNNLRCIRNHMMHFDPPCLVIPLEEVGVWLNQVLDIAFLLQKIRSKLGVPISSELANFMLQRDVVFTPEPCFQARLSIDSIKTGYLSSYWSGEQENSAKDEQQNLVGDLQGEVNDSEPSTFVGKDTLQILEASEESGISSDDSKRKSKGFDYKKKLK